MLVKAPIRKSLFTLLRYLKPELLFTLVYASAIYYLYELHDLSFLASFSFVPVGFLGTILSVFLAFRNNNSYSRWWEARQIWGDVVNASRMLGAQVVALVGHGETTPTPELQALHRELIHRHLACIRLFDLQLRGNFQSEAVDSYLLDEDRQLIRGAINPAVQLLHKQGLRLKALQEKGLLTDYQLVTILGTIERFYNQIGGCERIKNTPFPNEYDGFVKALIWLQLSITPIFLLSIFSNDVSKSLIVPFSILVTMIIGFANKAGEVMEDPFENRIHDVPMTALCNTIERDMLQQLGQSEVPAKFTPQDHVVW